MADYNSEFREFLKEIHAYYSRERNLRDVGGLTFQRVKDIAKELLDYGKSHPELLNDIINNPKKYPFHLFGVEFKNDIISAPTLGWTQFEITYRRRKSDGDPNEKIFSDIVIAFNPG